jgi:hypothetical protein
MVLSSLLLGGVGTRTTKVSIICIKLNIFSERAEYIGKKSTKARGLARFY